MRRFKEPYEYADDYYDQIALEIEEEDKLQREMESYIEDAVEKVAGKTHLDTNDFLQILAYGYENELPEAEKIARKLNLSEAHFLALNNKTQEFYNWLQETPYD